MGKTTIRKNDKARSHVWRPDPPDGWVYKFQPKHFCQNEQWCYETMADSGYVPQCERVDIETIRTTDLGPGQMVDNPEAYLSHVSRVLQALGAAMIRHGDLTEYSVLPRGNRPWIIDFAESRLSSDPRPDKRPEGDGNLLSATMRKQAVYNGRAPEMWHQIKRAVNFAGKSVLDVGCGRGDMLLYTHHAGARQVIGIDHDPTEAEAARNRVKNLPIVVHLEDAQVWYALNTPEGSTPLFDVVLCFAVVPYQDQPTQLLSMLKDLGRQAILEIQTVGDGPGKWEQTMIPSKLRGIWDHVQAIGQTRAKEKFWRKLYLCQ